MDARIFFSNPRIPKTIGSIEVSAWLDENHNRSNNATSYPVENGAEISDHIQPQPIELDVSGIIEAIDSGYNVFDAFLLFEDLMKSKQVITIVTGLKVYESMVVLTFGITRNANNGGSLSFTASLRQIIIVNSQSIAIPNSIITDSNVQAQAQQSVGKVTSGQSQQNSTEESGDSILAQVDVQLEDIFKVLKK